MKATLLNNNIASTDNNRLNASCVGWWDFTKISTSTGVVTDAGPNSNSLTVTLPSAPTINGGYCDFGALVTGIVLPSVTLSATGALVVAFGAKKVAGEAAAIAHGTAFSSNPWITLNGTSQAIGNGVTDILTNANNGWLANGDENMVAAFNQGTWTTTSAPTSCDLTVDLAASAPTGSAAERVFDALTMNVRAISRLGVWNLASPPTDALLAAAVQWMDAEWAAGNFVPYPLLAEWT